MAVYQFISQSEDSTHLTLDDCFRKRKVMLVFPKGDEVELKSARLVMPAPGHDRVIQVPLYEPLIALAIYEESEARKLISSKYDVAFVTDTVSEALAELAKMVVGQTLKENFARDVFSEFRAMMRRQL